LKYLLDTNIISEFILKKPNQKVLEFITSLDENHVLLYVITIGEIKWGKVNISECRGLISI